MASKGVDSYTFLTKQQSSLNFNVPKDEQTLSTLNKMLHINQQVDSSNINGLLNFNGPYRWQAMLNDKIVAQNTNQVSSLDGNIEGGDMTDIMNMPSIVQSDSNNFALSYGFYDAGPGYSGLTNQDQCYVYFTDSYERWMGTLVDCHPVAKNQPFHRFMLSGAHDAGMNTMNEVYVQLNSDYQSKFKIKLVEAFVILKAMKSLDLAKGIQNLAITQKDSFNTMLNLGTRYFDFRPGYLYSPIRNNDDTLYHQHSFIPGAKYQDFLTELLLWLSTHPSEIVIVNCNTAGFFAEDDMKPTPATLDSILATVRANTNIPESQIATGDVSSLNQTYQQLLKSNTQLIFLNQIQNETKKYDSYSDSVYATLDPQTIINDALSKMKKSEQENRDNHYDYTVLQIQGTSTNVKSVQLPSIITTSNTSSPLMSTKASFDNKILPWLLSNVNKQLSNEQLAVVLNDFSDNATASYCIAMTKQRMGID